MRIQESGEMYLETILILSKTNNVVRSVDVADHMNYSKPSVSRAMGLLKNNGYILIDNNGYITLTEKGTETANAIFERHEVLSKLFQSIGVDEKTAIEDACRVEHYISDTTFQALKKCFSEKNKGEH